MSSKKSIIEEEWGSECAAGKGGGMERIMIREYRIDQLFIRGEEVDCRGWALPSQREHEFSILVRDKNKKKIPCQIERVKRPDVGLAYFQDETVNQFGFHLTVSLRNRSEMFVTFREVDAQTGAVLDSKTVGFKKQSIRLQTWKQRGREDVQFIRTNGMRQFLEHRRAEQEALAKLPRKTTDIENYEKWFLKNQVSKRERLKQSRHLFANSPSVTFLLFATQEVCLQDTLESIHAQTYGNWELGIIGDEALKKSCRHILQKDSRIRWFGKDSKKSPIENLNVVLEQTTGEFVSVIKERAVLAPNALYELARAVNECADLDAFYSDEDEMDDLGKIHKNPHFKSDMNLELLRCYNYISNWFVVKRSIIEVFSGFHEEFATAWYYDFILRSVEQAKKVYHCPKILYSSREVETGTQLEAENGVYAIQAHYQRMGLGAVTTYNKKYGWYDTTVLLNRHPKVTILIPNKDHVEDLDKCLTSIYERATYDNYDVIVIENNSTESKTFAYYQKMQQEHANLQIVAFEGSFNYSAINNLGASHADGEYLLLLNNDTEVITPNFMEKMLEIAIQQQNAVVGALLYYPDDTIQHAGVTVGKNGMAAHTLLGRKRGDVEYMGRNVLTQNLSAVTGACLMVRKLVYDQLGGLDEGFAVAYNDVDFCLRVQKAGYFVVYQPNAQLYHYESKSRGYEDTKEKQERFKKEVARFEGRWGEILKKGDPYYNPNFADFGANFEMDFIN